MDVLSSYTARTRFLTEDSILEMLFVVPQADPDASVGDCPHRKKADEQDASSLVQAHLSIRVLPRLVIQDAEQCAASCQR